ncbi:MAG TPA: DUF4434 domain-containing protein [Phycisphaerae bacterium]|nr:DUF4434 domain-containing protein [Phycisphaerae bacterium]
MNRIQSTVIRAGLALACTTAAYAQTSASQPAAAGNDLAALPPPQCEPLVRGVLWWVDPAVDGPRVRQIVQAMADVGMNVLWIIGSNEFLTQADNPLLNRIFDEADRREWRVILATSTNGRWYFDWDIPALKKIEERNIRAMARMYAQRPSFFAWYINYEIYMEWGEKSERIRELYHCIGRLAREITPKAKLTISPFFLADKDQIRDKFRYADPEEYALWWAETLLHAGIGIVMLQDSSELHCRCVPAETRVAFFEAMQAACKAGGAELWGNVETVEVAAGDMTEYAAWLKRSRKSKTALPWTFDMTRNSFKLDLASRFSTNIVSWGWEYWNPVVPRSGAGDGKDNYAAYKEYFDSRK